MPIIFREKLENQAELAIWEIAEESDYFLNLMVLSNRILELLQQVNSTRRNQWLASRYLLTLLQGDAGDNTISKDQFGKPHFKDLDLHCSISHSSHYAAAIVGPGKVGIDVQLHKEKMERLAKKFLNDGESEIISQHTSKIDVLHYFWGAKEAMYKAYGRKSLSFKNHIQIQELDLSHNKMMMTGLVQKEEIRELYEIHGQKINQYFLVYAQES